MSDTTRGSYARPPEGWVAYGSHYDSSLCDVPGPLDFSDEQDEAGFPRWERHDGCDLIHTTANARSEVDHDHDR